MTPDTTRLRRLIAVLRELADRLATEVESVEREEGSLRAAQETRDRPALRIVGRMYHP